MIAAESLPGSPIFDPEVLLHNIEEKDGSTSDQESHQILIGSWNPGGSGEGWERDLLWVFEPPWPRNSHQIPIPTLPRGPGPYVGGSRRPQRSTGGVPAATALRLCIPAGGML